MNIRHTLQVVKSIKTRGQFADAFFDLDVNDFVEVGVWRGDYFKRLLKPCIKRAVAVDAWDQSLLAGAKSILETQSRLDGYYKRLVDMYAKDSRVEIMRATSGAAAATFFGRGDTFDVVYIDADHSYPGVSADIASYWGLVRDGGILCGHDYYSKNGYGVKRAVDEFTCGGKFLYVTRDNLPSWFVVKEA